MKNHFSIGIIAVCLLSNAEFLQGAPGTVGQPAPGQTVDVPQPTPYAITAQDGNSRVWQRFTYERLSSGEIVTNTHSYQELASGLNHLVNGKWVESSEHIVILPNGTAAATNGQHQAYFPGDIYQGQIELVTADGLQLQSRPVGLSYFDGTNSVLIAELTNSIGLVVGDNQVIYTNAFTDFAADVRYTYTKSGFEQDIILREQPPTPESYGLDSTKTRLQVLTEFFNPPEPVATTTTLPQQAGVALTDDTLDFGSEEMIPGRAFLLGTDAKDESVMVGKQWLLLDGRQFLVEEVPVPALVDALSTLPETQDDSAKSTVPPSSRVASRKLQLSAHHLNLPAQRLAKNNSATLRLARVPVSTQGYMLDYQTLSGSVANFIFQGDTTYYLNNTLVMTGNNIIEGGAVIKFSTNGSLTLSASGSASTQLNSKTAAYRPTILTAVDDNSAGETISGSTGSPSGYYGHAPAYISTIGSSGAINLSNFRISYATLGIDNAFENLPMLYDGQFNNCNTAVSDHGNNMTFRDMLFANIKTAIVNQGLTGFKLDIQNITFINVGFVADMTLGGSGGSFCVTNCIFANVTNLMNAGSMLNVEGGYNGFYSCSAFGANTHTSSSYPFQTVGAGDYYLTNGSNFRNVGLGSIDPVLAMELEQRTTYPPVVYSNSLISTNWTLVQQVQRDTNVVPDLGYHYYPLDYACSGVYVSNAIVTVSPGVVIGVFGTNGGNYGLDIGANAQFQCQGQPNNLNRIVEYNTVQEQPVSTWTPATGGSIRDSLNLNPETAINCRFTDWSVLAQDAPHFYGSNSTAINFRDCQFHGGKLQSYFPAINLTNCLLERVNADIEPQDGHIPIIRNNLMWNGTFDFRPGTVTNALIRDNLFDHTTIPDWIGGVGNTYNGGYNAYVSGFNLLDPTYTSDVILSSSPIYNVGLFGNYYLPLGSQLIDAGSTNANLVGLYQYTTQTNQINEANSIVDIGYHYVATDANGNPIDVTGDGVPDYLEDVNGNGLVDNGETNWALVILTQPVASQTVVQSSNVTFNITAAGVMPIVYQWYFNSLPILQATNATLTIDNVLTNYAGTYYATVTNNGGILLTSSNATLSVLVVPTISIVGPADGTVFIASQTNIALNAMAGDNAGTITQVQFFQGTTSLGVVASQPYNMVWSNAASGSYALTAQATDDRGMTSTSAVVNVVVEPLFTTNALALWLKPEAITNLVNNSVVTNWPDSSGWGNRTVHSAGGQSPTILTNILNGYPVVSFNPVSTEYYNIANLFSGVTGSGIEALVVLKVNVAKPTVSRALWQAGGNGVTTSTYPDPNGNISDDFGSLAEHIVGQPAQPLVQFHVYDVAAKNGNYWAAWINSELQFSAQTNPFNRLSSFLLGKGTTSGTYFDGNIAEVLIFYRALSAGERDAANGYLNLKYGLVTTPVAPTNLMATTISATEIGLTWSFGLTNTSTVFKIERMSQLGGYYVPCATVRDATSYVDTNLLVGTQYTYRIRASNAAGDSSYANLAQATTLVNGTDIPFGDLRLWLKADTGLVRQSTNSAIRTWFDQSGNFNDGNQGIAANQPSWLGGGFNGLPVVGFTATNNQYLTLPPQLLTNLSGAEAFVVVKAALAVPSASRQLWEMGSSGSTSVAYPDTSGNIVDDFGSTTAQSFGTTQPLDQYRVYNIAGQSGYWAAWINSQQLGTGNNTFGISTNYALGHGKTAYFDGDVAEVLIFDRVLATTERATVNGYLVNKYQNPMPTNVLVTATNSTVLNILWSDAAQFEPVTYCVDRKIGSGGTYAQIASVQTAYSFLDTNTIPDTNYYYRVRITNYFGQFGSMEVAPPIVDVTNPPAGSIFPLPNIPLAASASDSDGTVSLVQFMVANSSFGAANLVGTDTSSPYTFTWTNSFQGTYILTASAVDNGGNTRISAPITITTAIDSNGDGIPDYLQVSQGNDPLNPWTPPAFNTNDHTAPVITLLIPTNAVIVP